MTVVPAHDFSEEMHKGRRYRFGDGCDWCGAKTEDEAARKCRPQSSPCGEYYCPCSGDGGDGQTFDAKGRHVVLSNRELMAEARAIDEWARAEGYKTY